MLNNHRGSSLIYVPHRNNEKHRQVRLETNHIEANEVKLFSFMSRQSFDTTPFFPLACVCVSDVGLTIRYFTGNSTIDRRIEDIFMHALNRQFSRTQAFVLQRRIPLLVIHSLISLFGNK